MTWQVISARPLLRDQQIISARRALANGGYLFASASLPDSVAPPPRAGTVRTW